MLQQLVMRYFSTKCWIHTEYILHIYIRWIHTYWIHNEYILDTYILNTYILNIYTLNTYILNIYTLNTYILNTIHTEFSRFEMNPPLLLLPVINFEVWKFDIPYQKKSEKSRYQCFWHVWWRTMFHTFLFLKKIQYWIK